MKVTSEQTTVETFGDFKKVINFSLKNKGMVFDILRNKMYSDPILAIVREIGCNARDAHREIGKPNLPIEVYLPNIYDLRLRIKDHGPGLSPERIETVYTVYAESTKRDSNDQLGGFGLGSKTPWSYTDTFSVITVVDGIKYNYNAVIDESREGRLFLASEEKCDEENGTEIIVPVNSCDIQKFVNAAAVAFKFWDVFPIIKGQQLVLEKESDKYEILAEAKDKSWKLYTNYNSNYYNKSSYNDYGHAVVLIDGIGYLFNADNIFEDHYSQEYSYTSFLVNKGLRLYFNIGDLTISANRETLQFDEPTKAKLADRLKGIVSVLKDTLYKAISEAKSLLDAEKKLQEINQHYGQIIDTAKDKILWNGIALKGMQHTALVKAKATPVLINSYALRSYYRKGPSIENYSGHTINIGSTIYYLSKDISEIKRFKEKIKLFLTSLNSTKTGMVGYNNIQLLNKDSYELFKNDEYYSKLDLIDIEPLLPTPAPRIRTKQDIIKGSFPCYEYDNGNWFKINLEKESQIVLGEDEDEDDDSDDYAIGEKIRKINFDKAAYILYDARANTGTSTYEEKTLTFGIYNNEIGGRSFSLSEIHAGINMPIFGIKEANIKHLPKGKVVPLLQAIKESTLAKVTDDVYKKIKIKEIILNNFKKEDCIKQFLRLKDRINDKEFISTLESVLSITKELNALGSMHSSGATYHRFNDSEICDKIYSDATRDQLVIDVLSYIKKYELLFNNQHDLYYKEPIMALMNNNLIINYLNAVDFATKLGYSNETQDDEDLETENQKKDEQNAA